MDKSSRSCRLTIRFGPSERTVEASAGETLLDVLRREGLFVEAPCGGRGLCGGCRLRVSGDLSPADEGERALLGSRSEEIRLACRARLAGEATVTLGVPGGGGTVPFDGETRKTVQETVFVPLSFDWDELAPSASVLEGIGSMLARAGHAVEAGNLDGAASLGDGLRPGRRTSLLAVLREGVLAGFLPHREGARPLGAVCDIGTTTLVAYLVDLERGRVLAALRGRNPQALYGGDVLSRIARGLADAASLRALTDSVRAEAGRLLVALADGEGLDVGHCVDVLLVGNAVMHHLFLGLSPVTLGRLPFAPLLRRTPPLRAGDVALPLAPWARVRFLPLLGRFVGSDMTGLLVRAAALPPKRRLLVDVGTNGEIALVVGERIVVGSTAAGPAFEGGNVSSGMVALPGAVDGALWRDNDIALSVIGGGTVEGLCGPGLIDAVALLVQKGAVDGSGRIADAEAIPFPRLARRVESLEGRRRIRLGSVEQGTLVLTQKDIRELQLAKGALQAAMEELLDREELTWNDVDECLLAGAFGGALRPESLLALGLFPEAMRGRIASVGNGAGEGALTVLLGGTEAWDEAQALADRAESVDLEGRGTFQGRFIEALRLESRGGA